MVEENLKIETYLINVTCQTRFKVGCHVACNSFSELSPVSWILAISLVFLVNHIEVMILSTAFVDCLMLAE